MQSPESVVPLGGWSIKGVFTEAALIAFCQENISRFKAPKKVIFGPLPTTSTGKIQKFLLRQQLEAPLTA
ncbi:hypothetical protein [Halomonas urmiana]|uniref:hypothetical protein n=1 Tax=Halomonas urmiana TaxID=490901 RepID=UPI00195748DA|nr:hypothetical protein [Halomonas urmiana]